MSIRTNVKKIREAKRINQKTVANYLKISEMSYSRLENKNQNIDPELLQKIANFLNVGVNIFFDDKLTDDVINKLKVTN